MSLRILHVVPSFIPAFRYGGVVFAVDELARALSLNGAEVTICTTSVNGDQDSDVAHNTLIEMNGYNVIYFRSKKLRRFYYSSDMANYLNEHIKSYDIVHLHSIFLFPTNYAAKICRQQNIPYILTPHGMLDQDLISTRNNRLKSLFIRFFESKTITGANAIHVTSDLEYQNALKTKVFKQNNIAAKHKCWLIPNGIPELNELGSNTIVKLKSDPSERLDLLYIGRLSWKKRIEDMIASLKYLPDNIYLNIVGNDDENYRTILESCVEENDVSDRVIFHGPMYAEEKTNMFLNSKLCLVCSISENFALVVLEAMSYGCPVVLTKGVGASEIVKKNNAGALTTNDPMDIAQNIISLLQDKQSYLEMSERAINCASKYSWQNIIKNYFIMYEAYRRKY